MTLNQDRRRLAFIKAMVAAAWADGELNTGEIEKLTEYLQRFEITASEYDEIKPLLESPLSAAEADAVLDEQLEQLASPEERGALLAAVKDLLLANAELTIDESRFLERLEELVNGVSTPQLFVSRLRALWAVSPARAAERAAAAAAAADSDGAGGAEGAAAGGADGEAGEKKKPGEARRKQVASARRFLQKRLLEYFRRRIALTRARAGQPVGDDISDEDLYRVVVWAGLLSRVAAADNDFCPAEEDELVRLLSVQDEMDPADVRVVVSAYRDSGLERIDINLLVRELLEVSSSERASRLLDCLFLVAAADGELKRSELDLIRAISARLGFPDTIYRSALGRCERRMKNGWN